MRLAVISDIHGNLRALEAVLADARAQDLDVIVNAGDILSGPLEPAETAELLISLALPTIAGNHERQLLACEHAKGGASDQFAFERTSVAQRDWLRGLPSTLELGADVFICHGTPASDCTLFLEDVDAPAAQEHVERHAAEVSQGLIVCGHSHQPRVRALADGRLVVNPGSVGLQAYAEDEPGHYGLAMGSPHARYAIYEQTAHGWNVSQRHVAYDHLAAAEVARKHGRPEWAKWLATGRI